MAESPESSDGEDSADPYGESKPAPDFAPSEPTDGRSIGDWKTRYAHPQARASIRVEAIYVSIVLFLSVVLICAAVFLAVWDVGSFQRSRWLEVSPFVLSFLGGCLGGTLFTMKWLYHTVARGTWHRDRRLWRLFTPFLSGGAALAVVLLCASGVIPVFGPGIVRTNVGALGVSVLLGYFSDRAFSGLEQFLKQHMGTPRGQVENEPKAKS